MIERVVVQRHQVLAAQTLIDMAERGFGEVDGRIRAIAAGTRIRGTEFDYLVTFDTAAEQPA